ncbi:delta8-fatty-acid desaturase [Tremella mesenterica]|uniref:Delta 8-(E)-sphingolipid desaturase n=2 Tax=Tremella mesenterica TaxID=5217 RepID=A0A4Q1BFG8_TREME|nr:delta8-fatty-acid desaturase [Tremella mesenterica]
MGSVDSSPLRRTTPTPSSPVSRQIPLLTRDEVARRITSGLALFIHRCRVVNATSWLSHHPGGSLAILHFVGRDATDEVEAYHSPAALARMERFVVGRIALDPETGWRPLTPPIALGLVAHPDGVKGHWAREGRLVLGEEMLRPMAEETSEDVIVLSPQQLEPPSSDIDLKRERQRSLAYRQLKLKVKEAGLFDRPGPLVGYGWDIVRYIGLGGGAFGLFHITNGWIGKMISALLLGFLYHQLTFVVHDAGHTGITGDWWWDRVISMTVASWIGGLSAGWWCDNHNIHHLVTNHPEHDPDIQHIPFFAISKDFFSSLWSTYYKRVMAFDIFSKTLISVQHRLYYIVLSLARFNLYALSYVYLFGPKPKHDAFWRYELLGVAFFWVYFGAMLRSLPSWKMRLAYLLVSHIASSPVHVQIVLSHFACSTDDLGPTESFPSRQLRTTMDVVCSEVVEFIHGGLHLQVTHHLFPRLPRHNLRKASLLVKEYCAEQDLVYIEHGFVEGNRQVLGVLQEVARQIQFLHTVAEAEVSHKLQ